VPGVPGDPLVVEHEPEAGALRDPDPAAASMVIGSASTWSLAAAVNPLGGSCGNSR
jgi:hypothetical protein